MDYISICGFKCHNCPVYTATVNSDDELKKELSEMYSQGAFKFLPEDINCHGCHAENEKCHKFCGGCEIKACAISKNHANCGKCESYPCELLEKFVPSDSDNRKILNEVQLDN